MRESLPFSPRLRAPLAILLFALAAVPAAAQQQSSTWSVYSAFNNVQDVAFDSVGGVWAATTGGVLAYYAPQDSFALFRTTEGLITLSSSAIAVESTGRVFVGAVDGSLSIRGVDGSWTSLTEIAQFDRPDRRIYGFAFHEGSALVLTAFGVALLNLEDMTFRDTWSQLGSVPRNSPVYDAVIFRDSIWLATGYGVAAAPAGGRALSDPRYWRVFAADAGLGNLRVRSLAVVGGELTAATDAGAWTLSGDGTFALRDDLPHDTLSVDHLNDDAVAASRSRLYRFDGSRFWETPLTIDIPTVPFAALRDVAVSRDGRVASFVRGEQSNPPSELEGVALELNGAIAVLRPNAPITNVFGDLAVGADGSLWSSGSTWGPNAGVSRLHGEVWQVFTRSSHPTMLHQGAMTIGVGGDSAIWAGTWGAGLLRFEQLGDVVDVQSFNRTNSPVWRNSLVGDVTADPFSNRTWIVLYEPEGNEGPILMARLPAGDGGGDGPRFVTFDPPNNPTALFRSIVIDQSGTKWIGSNTHSRLTPLGLYYFSENGTIDDKTDDVWGTLTTSDDLLSNQQTALALDRDGALWIGTPDGLNVLDNPITVVESGREQASIRSIRPLRSVPVNAIEVDALNRKWIGTNQGVFVLSPDGVDVVERFTTANSPLVNDNVISIASDPATGAVYLGTEAGLSKLTTSAVESPPSPERIAVWPQPFIVPSAEPARISGLPSGATVKILTLNGHLIHQFDSPGGAVAFWDGVVDGTPVASGVYLISAGSTTGQETVVGKIAVIQR